MSQLFDLSGRNAVVVGGAGGLGQAIAQGLAEAGASVVIASRKEETLERAAKEIREACARGVLTCTVDATSEESVDALLAFALERLGKIDILVNAQGLNKKHPAEEFPLDEFRQMLEVNVVGVMNCCKKFGKHMIASGGGRIVNLSSVRGAIATRHAGNVAYCSTKGAVDMMTRQLASEFGPHNITVNAIGPTVTETPMMSEVIKARGPAYRQSLVDSVPMRRMAKPEDCVGPAVFLCSDAASFVTGQVIYPDGGLTAVG